MTTSNRCRLLLTLAILLCADFAFAQQTQNNSGFISSTQCVLVPASGLNTGGYGVTGTWTGTLTAYGVVGQGAAASLGSATTNGSYTVSIAGYTLFEVCGNTVGSGAAFVQVTASSAGSASSGGGCIATVSTLSSSCGTKSGTLASVTDGSTTSDCTTGGGTNKNACIYNGSAWAFAGNAGSNPTFAQVATGTNISATDTVGSGGTLNVASGAVIDFSLIGTGTFKIPQSAGCTSSATKNICLDTTANLLHVYQSSADYTFGTGAFAAAYSLPTATSSLLGGVKPDGTTILNSAGAISVGNLASIYCALAGCTYAGKVTTIAPTTGGAGLNLPPGTAPTSPVNGDCWTTSLGLYCQIAGATIGPYGTGSGGSSAGSQYGIQYNSNGTGGFAGITPPTTNCLYNINYNVIASASVAPTAGCPGFSGRAVTGTTSTDTILYSDNLLPVDYQGSVAVAVTLPTATTLGNSKMATELVNNTSGSSTAVTVTPTTWTVNGNSTLVIAQGQSCKIKADPSGTNWDADCHDLPMSAGTNITITRGQYGPTIAASGGGGGTGAAGSVYVGPAPVPGASSGSLSAITGAAATSILPYYIADPVNTIWVNENFLGGSAACDNSNQANVGNGYLTCNGTGPTFSYVDGVGAECAVAATSNDNCYLGTRQNFVNPGTQTFDLKFRVNLATLTNVTFYAGLYQSGNGRQTGIRFSTASSDTDWMFVTNNGTVNAVSSGVAPVAATAVDFRIRSTTAGTLLFSINGGTETSVTTDVPNALNALFFSVTTLTTQVNDFEIYYVSMVVNNLSR